MKRDAITLKLSKAESEKLFDWFCGLNYNAALIAQPWHNKQEFKVSALNPTEYFFWNIWVNIFYFVAIRIFGR